MSVAWTVVEVLRISVGLSCDESVQGYFTESSCSELWLHYFILLSCLTSWYVRYVRPFTRFTGCYYDITTVLVYESYLSITYTDTPTYQWFLQHDCVCDKLCQFFFFLSIFMDLFYIVVKYLFYIEVETYCFTSHRSFVCPISFVSVRSLRLSCRRSNTRRWPNVGLLLATVYDAEPTLSQYWVTVSCLTPRWMWASVTDGGPTITELWFKAPRQ